MHKAKEVNLDDQINKDSFLSIISNQRKLFADFDIILFFGRSFVINNNEREFFQKIQKNGRLFKTTNKDGKFAHPASIGAVEINVVNLEDFDSKNYIK